MTYKSFLLHLFIQHRCPDYAPRHRHHMMIIKKITRSVSHHYAEFSKLSFDELLYQFMPMECSLGDPSKNCQQNQQNRIVAVQFFHDFPTPPGFTSMLLKFEPCRSRDPKVPSLRTIVTIVPSPMLRSSKNIQLIRLIPCIDPMIFQDLFL